METDIITTDVQGNNPFGSVYPRQFGAIARVAALTLCHHLATVADMYAFWKTTDGLPRLRLIAVPQNSASDRVLDFVSALAYRQVTPVQAGLRVLAPFHTPFSLDTMQFRRHLLDAAEEIALVDIGGEPKHLGQVDPALLDIWVMRGGLGPCSLRYDLATESFVRLDA